MKPNEEYTMKPLGETHEEMDKQQSTRVYNPDCTTKARDKVLEIHCSDPSLWIKG